MNSALKPVLASAGVAVPSGQASPAKGNVASVNHASVALPQGAQNSLHNNLQTVGQNLTQHAGVAQPPPHAVPSMAPVTANMAQMAQNMSHHGNLSHVTQNAAPPAPAAAAAAAAAAATVSPSKAATSTAPLSLVADKPAPASQPLALTRAPDRKEPDSTAGAGGPANGTIESPKTAANAPNTLKPQNPETNKDKQDIAKTSPSTPKPPEKPSTAPSTPQKPEAGNSVSQVDGPSQPKVATANEPPAKSPLKPIDPKPTPTGDVAPTQSDNKPTPEAANNNKSSVSNLPEKAPIPAKQEPSVAESSKSETSEKPEQKLSNALALPEKPSPTSETKEDVKVPEKEAPKQEEPTEKPKTEEKEKVDTKKSESKPKSTLKLATVTPPIRKRRHTSPAKGSEGSSTAKKPVDESTPTSEKRSKRNRTKVQLYQSPTPEITMATKLSASAAGRSTPTKQNDDKLIVFYKNEYLAVRNAEGSFYVCQAMQNVYRTTRKIKIRWLSQDKTIDPSGETYKPDFYDVTDMECVLTTLSLTRAPAGGGAQVLSNEEHNRATSILQRALRAEQGRASPPTNPEHPDGLDLSLYTDESQLDKKSPRKRNSSKSSPRNKPETSDETAKETATPAKKTRTTPKRSPKSSRKAKTSPTVKTQNNNKRKALGNTSKTATAVSEKPKVSPKITPPKRSAGKQFKFDKPETPVRKGRRSAAKVEPKPVPVAAPPPAPAPAPAPATPSTSSGKTGRTPRKPPSRKI